MSKAYKPQGYSSVSAYIVADGAQRLLDFLVRAFAGKQLRRFDMPNDSIMHAEVQIDDTIVMICDSGDSNPAFPVWLHVYVADVDESYRRLLEAGGVSVQEPVQRSGDPDRRGGVKDPVGNTWWIATQVGEEPSQ
jgi:PhnB protein